MFKKIVFYEKKQDLHIFYVRTKVGGWLFIGDGLIFSKVEVISH